MIPSKIDLLRTIGLILAADANIITLDANDKSFIGEVLHHVIDEQ